MRHLNFENKKVLYGVLGIIFFLAVFLRFYNLSEFPVGFHIDEASKGYTAYSLLKTGKDDNGNAFPLYIDIFGDNSPSGYHVLTVIPVALFGLTEFSTRFPGAFIGALSIFAIYLLTFSIFKNKPLSVLASVLLAISPWHINLSRASNEGLVALFFIMLGFGCIFLSTQKQIKKLLALGFTLIAISFFFYQTPRLFVPLMALISTLYFLFFSKQKLTYRFKRLFILCFLALVLLDAILIFAVPGGSGRFTQVNIFTYPETQLVLDEQIREDGVAHTDATATRVLHNKVINYPLSYISNYFNYFSLNFLFINNLPPWYFVPGMGVMYLILCPFIIYGAFRTAVDKERIKKLLILWVLAAPIAAASAVDTNNIHRAIVLFPALEILAAYGILCFYIRIPKFKTLFAVILVCALTANFIYFTHQYFVHAKYHRPFYRNVGFKEVMQKINTHYDSYDTFVITKSMGGTYPLVQFYAQYSPQKYINEGSPKDKKYSGFGKYFFVEHECPSLEKDKKIPRAHALIINDGKCKTDIRYKEEVIYRPDNTPAFKTVDPNIKMRADSDKLDPQIDF